MTKKILLIFTVLLLSAITAVIISAQSVEKFGANARIDWTNLVYVAEGQGVIPKSNKEPNRQKALLKAKENAKRDAVANLLMAIEGTTISYELTGKEYMADTTIRQKIESYLKKVEIVSSTTETIKGVSVVKMKIKAPMFGSNGILQAFMTPKTYQSEMDASIRAEKSLEIPDVKVITKPDNAKIILPIPNLDTKALEIDNPSAAEIPYTGVIIDSTGYRIERAMSPKIRRLDGSEVWGTTNVDLELVAEKGIVSYCNSLDEAKKHWRAGSNPLIIRAIGRSGGKFFSDPVISDTDVQILNYENGKSHFLDQLQVIFIKDLQTI